MKQREPIVVEGYMLDRDYDGIAQAPYDGAGDLRNLWVQGSCGSLCDLHVRVTVEVIEDE